jgi:hypothetical protein
VPWVDILQLCRVDERRETDLLQFARVDRA